MTITSENKVIEPLNLINLEPLNATLSDNLTRVVYNDLFSVTSNRKTLQSIKEPKQTIIKVKTANPHLTVEKAHQRSQLELNSKLTRLSPPNRKKRKLDEWSEISHQMRKKAYRKQPSLGNSEEHKKVRFSETADIILPEDQPSIQDLIIERVRPEAERMKLDDNVRIREENGPSEDADSIEFMSDECSGSDLEPEEDFMFDFSLIYYVDQNCDPGLKDFLSDETLFLMDDYMRGDNGSLI